MAMEKQLFVTNSILQSVTNAQGDVEGVGTLRWVGDKLYRWVHNTLNVALAAGDVVGHYFADGADAFKLIENGATDDLGLLAGVVASTSIAASTADGTADGGYGWIQVLGYHAAAAILPSTTADVAAGATLVGADGLLTADGGNAVAMGTEPKYVRNLLLMEAVASATVATTAGVYVNCL